MGHTKQPELADLCGRRHQSAVCVRWPCHASVSPVPPSSPTPSSALPILLPTLHNSLLLHVVACPSPLACLAPSPGHAPGSVLAVPAYILLLLLNPSCCHPAPHQDAIGPFKVSQVLHLPHHCSCSSVLTVCCECRCLLPVLCLSLRLH